MGNEYKCNNNPQQLNHQRYSSFLLPMLCRLSIMRDVKVVKQCKDPSSPKVSCIGQVKRRNSKIHVGFPTAGPISSSKTHTKLKRFFSGKNFGDGEYSCRELLRRNNRSARKVKSDVGVKISELDPPLPVVQQQQPPGGDVKSLWSRRRSCGASLKTLEIHYIYSLPNNNQIIHPTPL
nr:uncharacterized protein LOC107869683 [Ipomoea batatas]